jgi:hypothetical protein
VEDLRGLRIEEEPVAERQIQRGDVREIEERVLGSVTNHPEVGPIGVINDVLASLRGVASDAREGNECGEDSGFLHRGKDLGEERWEWWPG